MHHKFSKKKISVMGSLTSADLYLLDCKQLLGPNRSKLGQKNFEISKLQSGSTEHRTFRIANSKILTIWINFLTQILKFSMIFRFLRKISSWELIPLVTSTLTIQNSSLSSPISAFISWSYPIAYLVLLNYPPYTPWWIIWSRRL